MSFFQSRKSLTMDKHLSVGKVELWLGAGIQIRWPGKCFSLLETRDTRDFSCLGQGGRKADKYPAADK